MGQRFHSHVPDFNIVWVSVVLTTFTFCPLCSGGNNARPMYTPGFTSLFSTMSGTFGASSDTNVDCTEASTCCRGGMTTSCSEYSRLHFFLDTVTAGRPSMNSCLPPKSQLHRCSSNQSAPIVTSSTSGDISVDAPIIQSEGDSYFSGQFNFGAIRYPNSSFCRGYSQSVPLYQPSGYRGYFATSIHQAEYFCSEKLHPHVHTGFVNQVCPAQTTSRRGHCFWFLLRFFGAIPLEMCWFTTLVALGVSWYIWLLRCPGNLQSNVHFIYFLLSRCGVSIHWLRPYLLHRSLFLL